MNLETVHFKELAMSDDKEKKEKAVELSPELLRALGSVPLDPEDLPVPGEEAWNLLHEEAQRHEKAKSKPDGK